MRNPTILAALGLLGLALAACDTTPRENLAPNFGNAVRHNMTIHIVNPDGAQGYEEVTPTDLDGQRSRDAYQRYRTGTVYPPVEILTTE